MHTFLLILPFCAATHPLGARTRAPPILAGPPALPRGPMPPAPPPAPTPARSLASPVTELWSTSTPGSWYYGAALTAGAALATSFGDPYHPPYAWSVATFGPLNTSAPGPAPRADFTFPSVPGSVWGSRGGAPLAMFSGMSFTDEAAVVAAYSPGAPAPAFEETLPGVSGNWWQTGANVGASGNGSIIGYAFTGLARYDPLGPKRAQVLALDLSAVPARELLYDALPNGTGVEGLRLSADGSTLVAWAAIDPAGQINSSLVRVYDVRRGALVAQWVAPYVLAACLSPSGASLVLATCDSENSLEAFSIDLSGEGRVAQTLNSSYPSFAPSQPTFTYAAFCEATDAGALWVAFPLWWGGAINQTAVAFYAALPRAPPPAPYLAPTALWLSPPISAARQDDLIASAAALDPATGESFFVFVGWGGGPAASGGPCPPTLRVFRSSAPGAPAAEVATPSAGDASVSGSLESVDAALLAGGQLLIVAGGLDGHANDGSTGGRLLAWLVALAPGPAAAQQLPNIVASPPSTLLPPGATTLPLTLTTSVPTACKWDPANVSFPAMAHPFATSNGTTHAATLTNLSGGLATSLVFVQCAAFAAGAAPLVLGYRSLPDSGAAPFPRLGNLWGSGNFRGHPEGLAYAARRASLWLGSDWSAEEIAQLRGANPFTLVTTSINACEVNAQDLPEEFYLLNITQPPSTRGRLQSWPGAWRLDLTNPVVQEWQAGLMYCLVIYGGTGYGEKPSCNNATLPPMLYDGLFIDNVFMDDGAAVNSQDIFHNPFIPVDRATGLPMSGFNEKWRAGMVNMIALLRQKLPHGILDGHAMDVGDANITAQFNAISIGFVAPEIVEGLRPFAQGLATYNAWMTLPQRSPRVTMVESAVRFQLGYGYGFDRDLQTLIPRACENSNSVPGAPPPAIGDACGPPPPGSPAGYLPPQTFLLARSEYRYMRFGLGFTLMYDGYYTHELGDSWHGMDWAYDELDFSLGLARGNATPARVLAPPPAPVPPAIPLSQAWFLYVRDPVAANASWALDPAVLPAPGAPASARVDVAGTAAARDGIDLSQVVALQAGGYVLSFWARASRAGTPVHLNARKNGGDWHSLGLDVDIVLGLAWAQFNVTFVGSGDGSQARLSWWMGAALPGTSLWVNSPTLLGEAVPLPVLTREFECGVVVLNGHTAPATVDLGAWALARLRGEQAPLHQVIVDDASSAWRAEAGGAWVEGSFDSGYHGATTPEQEEVRPANGFYHHWARGARVAPGGSSSSFDLGVTAAGLYNVSLWWPAAVPARAGWARAMAATVGGARATLDLTAQGGDVFFPVAGSVALAPGARLLLECPAGGGACVADAVLVESEARYNDGSAAAEVVLQPMDSIVLRKVAGAPAHCA